MIDSMYYSVVSYAQGETPWMYLKHISQPEWLQENDSRLVIEAEEVLLRAPHTG